MGFKRYTNEQLEWLKKNRTLSAKEATRQFNDKFQDDKTVQQINVTRKRYKWKTGRKGSEGQTPHNKIYESEHIDWFRDNATLCIGDATIEFNKEFNLNKTERQIQSARKRYGFKTGRTGRFVKGHVPANKGKKGTHGPNSGSFKKGDRPANALSVGTEIVNSDGYIKVKIAEPSEWKFKHVIEWEKHIGEIGDKNILIFLDGDKLNCNVDNLVEITRAESLYLNSNGFNDLDIESRKSLILLAAVETKRFRLTRRLKREQEQG